MPLSSENSRYQSRFNENAVFRNFNDTPCAPVVTQHEQPNATHSPPNTDLGMDWADACRATGMIPAIAIISRLLCLQGTCGSFKYFPRNALLSFCRNIKSAVHVPYAG